MFRPTKVIFIGALLATLAACSSIQGTASIPNTSRTGEVHDVNFAEHMTPVNLRVRPGDEVRWVNQRSTSVSVEFLGDALDNVSCQRGFSSLLKRQQESATIEPNQSVSLCFDRSGTITYNARMVSAVAGGQTIQPGTIQVRP